MLHKYWYLIHPGNEDGEIILPIRAKWLSWMGSSRDFLEAVKSIPITAGPGIEPHGWGAYESSQRVDEASLHKNQDAYNEMIEAGHISGDTWRSALGGTPRDHLGTVLEALRASEDEVEQLKSLCEDKFSEDAPNLLELSSLLFDCRTYLEGVLEGEAAPEEGAAAEAGAAPAAAGAPAAAAPSGPSGPIGSRDEAYRRLREVAEYLRRTEPHSPVSYLVERAIHWGQMPFQDVIKDVLKGNVPAYSAVLETLGIQEEK
jgi:type VI secretion system protein ImpA